MQQHLGLRIYINSSIAYSNKCRVLQHMESTCRVVFCVTLRGLGTLVRSWRHTFYSLMFDVFRLKFIFLPCYGGGPTRASVLPSMKRMVRKKILTKNARLKNIASYTISRRAYTIPVWIWLECTKQHFVTHLCERTHTPHDTNGVPIA